MFLSQKKSNPCIKRYQKNLYLKNFVKNFSKTDGTFVVTGFFFRCIVLIFTTPVVNLPVPDIPASGYMLLQGRQLIKINAECWDVNLTSYKRSNAEWDQQYDSSLKGRKAVLCIFQEFSEH